MGCYPIKKLISKAIEKCNGNERSHRHSCNNRMVYTPPVYSQRTVQKSVNFSNHNPVYIIPSNPEPEPTVPNQNPEPGPPSMQETPRSKKERKKTRFAPEQVHRSNDPPQHGPAQRNPDLGQPGSNPNPVRNGPVPYYAPSPLPRWEEGPGVRRPEFFGGEYRYYPTPIREGIYDIATDPHRLTAMFNEENPNACSIC